MMTRTMYIEPLSRALIILRTASGELAGQISRPIDRAALCLYCTMLELAGDIETLARAKPSISIPTVTRQLLDAYVDLINVLDPKQPDYWRNLEVADARTWKIWLERASAGRNSYMRQVSQDEGLPATRRANAIKLKEQEDADASKLEAQCRFTLAGMKDVYEAVWSMLSAYAHNNMSCLFSRHFVESADGSYELYLAPDRVPYELACILQSVEFLADASERIHRRFGTEIPDLASVLEALQRLVEKEGKD